MKPKFSAYFTRWLVIIYAHLQKNFLSVQSKFTLLISANIYELKCCCTRKTAANLSVVLSVHFVPTEHSHSTVISSFLYIWEKAIELN